MPDDSAKGPGFAVVFDDSQKGPGFGGMTIGQLREMATAFSDSAEVFAQLKELADKSGTPNAAVVADHYGSLSGTFTTIAGLWTAAEQEAERARSAKVEICKAALERLEQAAQPVAPS